MIGGPGIRTPDPSEVTDPKPNGPLPTYLKPMKSFFLTPKQSVSTGSSQIWIGTLHFEHENHISHLDIFTAKIFKKCLTTRMLSIGRAKSIANCKE